jgi:hypothetical protein
LFCGVKSGSKTIFGFIFLLARSALLGETFLATMGWFTGWASGFFGCAGVWSLSGRGGRGMVWRNVNGGGCPSGMGIMDGGPNNGLNDGTDTRL